ncbi:hypothetical protein PBY51_015048 [Eleginops maclovinus]|uniref:Beta-microseminoprotein n=1 Tax=Eleginops maclovinus TaxID=56733 RepID=A0AAN7X2E2_ELEMC|nr:hypothetical protein PBY51_015048 [Eleginops maclovinus]
MSCLYFPRLLSECLFACLDWLSCVTDCFFEELVLKDLNHPPTGCVDKDGKQHDFGTEWDRDCMACSCTAEGMSCCSKIPDADTVNAPAHCELVVNKEACTFKTVMKSDMTKECTPI